MLKADMHEAALKAWRTKKKAAKRGVFPCNHPGCQNRGRRVNMCFESGATFCDKHAKEDLRRCSHRRTHKVLPRYMKAHEAWCEKNITRRIMSAFTKARAEEAASKKALEDYCAKQRWKLAFFEGPTGSPRTGIIDAILFRLSRKNPDLLDVRFVQLKGGKAGVSGSEIARLKKAVEGATINWLIAAFDGESLHMLPDDPTVK